MTQPTFLVSTMTAAEEAAWMAAMRGLPPGSGQSGSLGLSQRLVTPGKPPTRHKQRPMTIRKERIMHPKPAPSDCVHHMVLEPPDGPVTVGKCKKCGREKTYKNALDVTTFSETHGYHNRTWRD